VVETGGLENRLRGDSHGGSNPSSSAITYLFRLSKFTGDYFLCARNLPDFIARTSEFRPKAIGAPTLSDRFLAYTGSTSLFACCQALSGERHEVVVPPIVLLLSVDHLPEVTGTVSQAVLFPVKLAVRQVLVEKNLHRGCGW
jgi:hypothetical protein